MSAESPIAFEALDTQAASIMQGFREAGYERVAPAFIQPASLFLDRIGETIRARTYVFSDPNGEELCLRPDLTVPVARIFLERQPPLAVAKFCYNGPAFRVQEGKADPLRPREFRQAGIEYFGGSGEDADVEVFSLILDAVRSAGLTDFTVRIGHIGIFTSLLASLAMPQRWRERLAHAFWRPTTFMNKLHAMSNAEQQPTLKKSFLAAAKSERALSNHLKKRNLRFIGVRRPSEIIQRLRDKAADTKEPPLPQSAVSLISSYLAIRGSLPEAVQQMRDLFRSSDATLAHDVEQSQQLFMQLQTAAQKAFVHFDADFGRHFEYYSGMVFQIEVEAENPLGHLAGGGRYDGLISALSAGNKSAPAVGAAIHTERLLMASRRNTT